VSTLDEEALLRQHAGLIHTLAAKYLPVAGGLEAGDLAQEARLGVLKAARMFDPTRGVTFSTVAWNEARYAILKAIRWQQRHCPEAVSLDQPLACDGATLADTIPDDRPGPEQQALQAVAAQLLRQALPTLPPHSRRAVELRYGLGTGEPMTLQQVAIALGCSYWTAAQRVERGLALLRRRLT
jgi:RNA polymerase sigma factor (sigma-70 family)